MPNLDIKSSRGEIYQQLLQTPVPPRKTPVSETPSAPLTGNSQGFGRVLTIVGTDCALLECDGHIRLLALPVAERWLRQAQLTPDQGVVCAQPLLIPLRLKVTADEKSGAAKRAEPTG
ncbi:DNA mismatch repair protein [Citrobacter braakii]|nr:DNA mismatch repair protein [Citrobacter braakii]